MVATRRIWSAIAVCVSLAAAVQHAGAADENTRIHHRVAEAAARDAPRKLLILPSEISIYELSAGGVRQKVPELTREANRHADEALLAAIGARGDLVAVPMPKLTEEEQDEVDDLVATFDVVAGDAYRNTRAGRVGWEDRVARFDYTLGYGLPWLKTRYGADALLATFGFDYQSTGGRKAMAFLGVLAGVVLPVGFAEVRTGIVDLESGEILWLHVEGTATGKLSDADAMRAIVDKSLASLPQLGPKR